MAYQKLSAVDKIEVVMPQDFTGETIPDAAIQVREAEQMIEDSTTPATLEGGPRYSRHVVDPASSATHPNAYVQMIGALLLARENHTIEEVRDAVLPAIAPLLPSE